jgi:hypothetical protein
MKLAMCLTAVAAISLAQTPAGQQPAFEVAAIKPIPPQRQRGPHAAYFNPPSRRLNTTDPDRQRGFFICRDDAELINGAACPLHGE